MSSLHLTDYNESERADYMVVVAAMARAHGELTSQDVYALRELSLRYVLGPEARGRVIAASSAPPENMEHIIKHLAHTRLKHSLFLDVCAMAYHHGSPAPAEQAEVQHIAELLQISEAELASVEKFAKLVSPAAKGAPTPADLDAALNGIEAAGVPHGALALSAILMGIQKDDHATVHAALGARKK